MQADREGPISIAASENGRGRQTIVFVHGFGANHSVWDEVAAPLQRSAKTIAYDLPGHGPALDAPGAGSAKFAARTLLADLSLRGIETAHLVGHSMGGAVAALMALSEPQRIASLTLLAPGGFGPEINAPLLRRYAEAADAGEIRACIAAMSGPGVVLPDNAAEAYLAMRSRPGQTEKLVEIAAAITRGDRQGEIPRELLATLTMPVTVLWGTNDPVVPFAQAKYLPAHFTLRIAHGAGHMLIGEMPDLVREAIRANLDRPD